MQPTIRLNNIAPKYQSSSPIHMLTNDVGGSLGASNENGFYDMSILDAHTGKAQISYTDYKTKQRVILCGDPNCLHLDETCTSIVDRIGIPFCIGEKLYLYQNANLAVEHPTEKDQARIIVMESDGSDRKQLYQFPAGEYCLSGMAADEAYIFFTNITVNKSTATTSYELCRLSLNDGKLESLLPTDEGTFLVGGYADGLILKQLTFSRQDGMRYDYGQAIHSFLKMSLSNRALETLYSWDASKQQKTAQILDNWLFVYDVGVQQLESISLESSTVQTVSCSLPMEKTDFLTFLCSFQSNCLVSVSTNSNSSSLENLYVVDTETGMARPFTLAFGKEPAQFYQVLARIGDEKLLVLTNITTQLKTRRDMSGELRDVSENIPVYSLMSCENFFANRDIKEEILDCTI